MDLDSAWEDTTTAADPVETQTYTDAMGAEATEALAPMPPPMLREGGASAHSEHVLARHTGTHLHASRAQTDGGLASLFDPADAAASAEPLRSVAVSSRRTEHLVDRNRKGTQPSALRDDAERTDVYHGYNVRALPREPRGGVGAVTARAVIDAVPIYGAQTPAVQAPVAQPMARTPLRAGAVTRDDARAGTHAATDARTTRVVGSSSARNRAGALARTTTNMSRFGAVAAALHPRVTTVRNAAVDARALGSRHDSRVETAGMARGTHARVRSTPGVIPVPVRSTDGGAVVAARTAVHVLGASDSTTARSDLVPVYDFAAAARTAVHVLGASDSTTARSDLVPVYDFAAAARTATHIIGESDSTTARSDLVPVYDFAAAARTATHIIGESDSTTARTGVDVFHPDVDAVALRAARASCGRTPSVRARVGEARAGVDVAPLEADVPERTGNAARAVADDVDLSRARRANEDAMPSRAGAAARALRSEAVRAREVTDRGARRSEAAPAHTAVARKWRDDVVHVSRAARNGGAAVVQAMRGALRLSTRAITHQRSPRSAAPHVVASSVMAAHSRAQRADGVQARGAPLQTGAFQVVRHTSHSPPRAMRTATAHAARRNAVDEVRANPPAMPERVGTRA